MKEQILALKEANKKTVSAVAGGSEVEAAESQAVFNTSIEAIETAFADSEASHTAAIDALKESHATKLKTAQDAQAAAEKATAEATAKVIELEAEVSAAAANTVESESKISDLNAAATASAEKITALEEANATLSKATQKDKKEDTINVDKKPAKRELKSKGAMRFQERVAAIKAEKEAEA